MDYQRSSSIYSLFHPFVHKGFEKIVRMLIEKGVEVDALDVDNDNALFLASLKGKNHVIC